MTSDTLSLRQWRALVLSVVFAAAAYLIVSVYSGWTEVLVALGRVGVGGFALALGLSLVNYGLRFVRWQYYLKLLGHSLPWPQHLTIYLAGFALTTTPGKAGELVRSLFLSRDGVPYAESVAAFFSERLSDLIAVLLLAMLGILAYEAGRPVFYVLVPLVLLVLFVLSRHRWLAWIKAHLANHAGRIATLLTGLVDVLLHSGRLYRPAPLSVGLGLGLIAWAAEAYAFYLMIQWMGLSVDLSTAVAIYAFAMLVGAVSFLPGGLGSAELAMVALLMLARVPQPEAVALTVLIRVATLWFAVVLGMLALIVRGRAP